MGCLQNLQSFPFVLINAESAKSHLQKGLRLVVDYGNIFGTGSSHNNIWMGWVGLKMFLSSKFG